ncbi:FtsX-like permease family protein [Georgenia sp. Z1344]|uniref:ABC transporter permease n=1 Tax=Georgenia sp. Z1344 TaxID=3416706 RepID=UPI003CF4F5CB
MFVAWRDLRFASGRFALMTGVVVLITFLVTFLSALTSGLARESTSAIADLPADHLAFGSGEEPSFTSSQVDAAQREAFAGADGVEAVDPLGVATTRSAVGGTTASVTVLGAEPGASVLPEGVDLADGSTWLSGGAAEELDAAAGDTLAVAGQELVVAGVADVDASFSHTPVVWTTLADWQAVGSPSRGGDGGADGGDGGAGGGTGGPAAGRDVATVLALTTSGADLAALDAEAGTMTVSRGDSLQAIGSYSSENGSLMMMQGFLYAISALVVGSFFTVWTISRSDDVAVLKALGASTGYLMRDALGQATVVLLAGTVLGSGLATATAWAISGVMPVAVGWTTTVLPVAILVGLGLLGAGLALRRLASVDPHAALSAS